MDNNRVQIKGATLWHVARPASVLLLLEGVEVHSGGVPLQPFQVLLTAVAIECILNGKPRVEDVVRNCGAEGSLVYIVSMRCPHVCMVVPSTLPMGWILGWDGTCLFFYSAVRLRLVL